VEWTSLAKEFRRHGACFENALISGGWPGDYGNEAALSGVLTEYARSGPRDGYVPEVVRLMHVLLDAARIDLVQVIDEGALAALGCKYMKPDAREQVAPRVPTPIDRSEAKAGPRELTAWLIGLGPRVLQAFFQEFAKWKNDGYAAALALGVRGSIERWLTHSQRHWTYFREAGPELAEACMPYFDELGRHCVAAPNPPHPEVRRTWLWFAWCVFEADPNLWRQLDEPRRETVLRAANEDVAALRKLLARAKPKPIKDEKTRDLILKSAMRRGVTPQLPPLSTEDLCQGWGHLLPSDAEGPDSEKVRAPWEEFEWERDHLQTCLFVLFRLGGVWRGLKPMLLALRSLATPAVAPDLRHWVDPDREPPPEPWCTILEWPINLFQSFVGNDPNVGKDLVVLRSELAAFCLERLVDRWGKAEREQAQRDGRARTNEDMVERSPDWRYAYVRAVSVLGVNPEGKGHRILHMSMEIDPDPDVRDAAKHAYEQMRRGVGLPEDTSPRRAVMSALWWLRQRHLHGLGIQPDPDGAQRTRIKELSRSKEYERANVPATRDNNSKA
jgi:hypothetical protein